MSTEENKALVRRTFFEAWNKGDLTAIAETHAEDYVYNDPAAPQIRDREGFKQLIVMYRAAYPDIEFTLEDQIAEGDKVVTRWYAIGTHEGELMGIAPTGIRGSGVTGISIERIAGGKIVETWTNWDTLGMLQNLGVIPPLGQG